MSCRKSRLETLYYFHA